MWKSLVRYLFIAYFIVVHVALAFVLIETNLLQKYAIKWGLLERPNIYYYNAKIARHLRGEYKLPDSIILLLGDSITEALPTQQLANNMVNYGVSRDDTAGVLRRMSLYGETFSKAEAVFLAIGINDLHLKRPMAEIVANYHRIVAQFPTDKPVILSAVLPITAARDAQWQVQSQVEVLNREIAKLATQQPNYHFFDGATAMADAGGYLRDALHRGDGIHLNAAGYTVWSGEIAEFMQEIGIL